MKSEILKLLTENIDKFHPLDFIIIFVISILAGLTCYRFFRWIYRDVYEAQEKSLYIKNGIISDLEKKSTLIEQQKQMVEAQMDFVSNYAISLESELTKVHHEKTKAEEQLNLLKSNALTLQYTIILLLLAKNILRLIETVRNFIIGTMILADKNEIPKNEKTPALLFRMAKIEARVMEAMSTVDSLIPYDPEAFQKLGSSTKLLSPELRKFDFKSAQEKLEEIFKESQEPYLELLGDSVKPSEP
jgi:hypothetical protein